MRELKFRAWDKTNKKMLDRVLAGPGDPCSIVWLEERKDWVQFDEFCGDIMQYTGLTDKTGKDIYEGDIVQLGHAREEFIPLADPDTKLEVFYTHGGFHTKEGDLGDVTDWHECEVIGNIYEHPELIQ